MKEQALHSLRMPEGTIGHIAGHYMAQEYYEVNLWAVDMLHVSPGDKILEIGSGPGIALEAIVSQVSSNKTNGKVVGLDCSEIMLQQAAHRNHATLQSGEMELIKGSVDKLPHFNYYFDKMLAVNTIMYWNNPAACLRRLMHYLKPGGFIAIVLQRGYASAKMGLCQDEIEYYTECLHQAGFSSIGVEIQRVQQATKVYRNKNILTYGFENNKRKQSCELGGICIYAWKPVVFSSIVEELMYSLIASYRKQLQFHSDSMPIKNTSKLDFLEL